MTFTFYRVAKLAISNGVRVHAGFSKFFSTVGEAKVPLLELDKDSQNGDVLYVDKVEVPSRKEPLVDWINAFVAEARKDPESGTIIRAGKKSKTQQKEPEILEPETQVLQNV